MTLEGLDKAKMDVKEISDRAVKRLAELSGQNTFLEELVEMLVTREK